MNQRKPSSSNSKVLHIWFSTYIGGKSIMAEKFIRKLNAKICKNMTANDNKSHLSYFNKLVDQYNNTYHDSINKKTY